MAIVEGRDGKLIELTPKQHKYVKARLSGVDSIPAARLAGYSNARMNAKVVAAAPVVQSALDAGFRQNEKRAEMTKQKVINGMLEAVEQAKMLADPNAQVNGWREIAKMCGYYEPQRLQVEVSVSAKRMLSQYEALSDEELLKLADQTVIDSDDFEVIDDDKPE